MTRGATPALLLALMVLSTALVRAADDPLATATKLYDKRRYEQAARLLEEALPRLDETKRAQALLVLGTIYLRAADLHQAFARTAGVTEIDYLDKLAKTGIEGRSRYVRLYLAEALLARGDTTEAGRYFDQLRADVGVDAAYLALAQVGLGSVAWSRKQTDRARALWNVAGSAPNVALARAAAQASAGDGDVKTWLRVADDVNRGRELAPRVRRYLLEIYLAAGVPEKALATARSGDLTTASYIETFRAAKGTAKSISFYDYALLNDLARLYRELARGSLEQAARDERMRPSAQYYLAEVYTGLGRHEEAQKYAQAFLAQAQAPAQYRERTRVRAALVNYRQGKRVEAENAWGTIAETGGDPEVLADVALACADAGAECAKAIASLVKTAEAADGRRFARFNFALGTYYLRKKDYARAITYMEAGRDKSNKNKIEANDPEMLAGLAEAYYRTRKFSEGLEIFFEMSKEFPVVRQIQEAMQGVYSMEQRSAGDVKIL